MNQRILSEVRSAAKWSAQRGLLGQVGDPLPTLLSTRALRLINADPPAFQLLVREARAAIAKVTETEE